MNATDLSHTLALELGRLYRAKSRPEPEGGA